MQVVLDTNVWKNALSDEGNIQFRTNCLYVLVDFMQLKSFALAVDNKDIILNEYRGEIGYSKTFQLLFKQLYSENRINRVNGSLNRKNKNDLLTLGFHELTDQTFAAVAFHADKYLVSDDSDFGTHEDAGEDKQKVHNYMSEEMEITVESSRDALIRFNNWRSK